MWFPGFCGAKSLLKLVANAAKQGSEEKKLPF
jgi:hypothetical protein